VDEDERRIRRLMDDWRRHTTNGNLDGVLALMTDDALFLTPGHPPMPRQEFAAGFRAFAGRVRIEATQDIKEIFVSGDVAYAWTHISAVMSSVDSGGRSERAGHVLTIFRRTPRGDWLLARDANMLAPVKK
jgi:uncharacterized protein (TIGR02246 family)